MRDIAGIPAYFAGFVEDIEPAMAGLDLLLHPSRTEGLGTAVLDAMALGVPAVAFATGGIPEVITDHATGLLVPEGDLSGFAGATGRLITDPDFRKMLGDAARIRAKSFDALEMTKGTEAVYNRVLRGWR
jgi:glycosyltransferase involved in cell wall biosynthesis